MAQRYQRVTVAFDGETYALFESMHKQMKTSQSDALRRMVRHYAESPPSEDPRHKERMELYAELLGGGEHVILDIDHLSALLRTVGTPTREFREALRAVALSHADQWRDRKPSPGELLERLEACNFFKVGASGGGQFTLLPNSEAMRDFAKWVVSDFLEALGYRVEVREDLAKLRVKVEQRS
jgi:hypothetical protein